MGTNRRDAFTTLLCLLFCITISAQDKAADLSKLVGDCPSPPPTLRMDIKMAVCG